jgi:hypothetical protein
MPAFYPEGDDPKIGDAPNRSLQKINSLLKSIDTKTGSTTITGPVTVSNEVEVTNSTGNPIPVSGTVGLDSTSLAALENISVTFPATQNVNVTNAGLNVSASTLPLPAGASTETTLASVDTRLSNIDSDLGSISESAASTDTSISGINGLLKRLLQRITTLIYPPFASGSFTNSGGASTGIDCGGYDYLVQHISGGGGGYNRPIAWSYDNVNWAQGGVVFRHISNAGSSSTGNEAHWTVMGDILGTSSGIFVIPVVGRYFRVNASTGGGGSWTHNWYLHKGPFPGIVEEGIGSRSSTAATTDTSDVGLNGLFKRLLQRLTTLLPANLTVSSTRLLVDGSGVTQPVSLASVPSHPVTGTFWQATQPVSIASAPVTPVTDNGGSLTVDGTVTVNDMTSGNAKTKIVDSTGADVSYIPAGTAGTPSSSVVTVQGISGGTGVNTIPNAQAIKAGIFAYIDDEGPIPVIDGVVDSIKDNLGFQDSTAATSDTGTFSISSLIKRGLQNWTSLLAKIPALVSGRIPVDGSGVTQPVSLASVPSHPVTGSGSFTAAQATASSLKAQAQILNSAGSLVTYAETGTYGSPSIDVISVQNPQGATATITTFTSTTASTSLIAAGSTRKGLTVYNSGAGDLYISPTAVCTTTNFQIRLSSGDYWECPASQVLLSHTAVFASAGTAYITAIT